jgi:hypothetical protein
MIALCPIIFMEWSDRTRAGDADEGRPLMKTPVAPWPLTFPLIILMTVTACDVRAPKVPPIASFQAAFVLDTLVLQELPGDSLMDIAVALESMSGGLLVADRYRARLLRYSATGELVGAYGRFGAGPGEFRGIDGLAEDSLGRLFVVDSRLNRVTVLSPELAYLHVIDVPFFAVGPIVMRGGEAVLAGFLSRQGNLLYSIDEAGKVLWSAYATPDDLNTQPYWATFADVLLAATDESLAVGTALLYPLSWLTDGTPAGMFGAPPPSWRHIPAVERGAFAAGPMGPRFEEWISSFTVIGGLYLVADRHIAVVHSRLVSHPLSPAEKEDYALDVYDLDGTKLLEDVALPDDARVIAGGHHLYVVVSQPPQPWKLVRASLARP